MDLVVKSMGCLIFFYVRSAFAGGVRTAWDYSPLGECVKNYAVSKPTADYPMTVQALKNGDIQKNLIGTEVSDWSIH
jgi:hypothetical protein